MKRAVKWLAGAAGVLLLAQVGGAWYLFRQAVVRKSGRRNVAKGLSGTDWSAYRPVIQKDREWMERQPREEVWISSEDGLKLHGVFYPLEGSKKAVIGFHGYGSQGTGDYVSIARFFLENGIQVLAVDERAHGKSEGNYIGFGCLERLDAAAWARYLADRLGEDGRMALYGVSMGGATVLMASGRPLPPQVKAVISDCGFTSAWDIFSWVLRASYHLPAFPMLYLADWFAARFAGYHLNQCDAREEVRKAKVPVLLIHGEADHFVPAAMACELYEACGPAGELLLVPEADHAEAYYKDPERYRKTVEQFLFPLLEKED